MKKLNKIFLFNILGFLVYTILFYIAVNTGIGEENLGYLLLYLLICALHVLLNLVLSIVSFVQRRTNDGLYYLICLICIPLIGFSACYGIAMVN